ncbi:small secreted hydrophilic protein [Streptomyces sp. NPDC050315]|uniref:small secreted hydrophilic protein n=1 Tax=Streptomyces sp. NPDC050315 TaxID=3155039 RepID=UPI0034445009
MAFSQRMAVLAAVVAIPLGIAATSYVLTDSPETPKAPPKVELDSGSPSAGPTRPGPTPSDEPSDEVVSRPPVSDDASDDGPGDSSDDDDDRGAGDRDDG